MRPQCVKAMPDRRAQRLMTRSRTENFQVREEQDPVSAFFPFLTLGLLTGQEYCWGCRGFPSPCMFYHGFYSVLFWITSSFTGELEKAGSVLGPVYCLCPLKTCLGSEFSGKKPGCLEVPWRKNGQHWKLFFKVWPRQDPFYLAGFFSSLIPPEQQKRTQLAIVSGPTGSLELHRPGRAAFLVH